MKKILKIVVIIAATAFVVLQFFRPDRTNPPIVEAETLEAATSVPAEVQIILSISCNDCHSHKTVYPWYSNISPFSWFLADHIEHARGEVNFSVWNTYDINKKARKLEEICEMVEAGAMPLPSYLWIHRDAALSESNVETLCNWVNQEKLRLDQ